MEALTWMAGQSVSELRSALRRALPRLATESIVLQAKDGQLDPRWHSGSAVIGGAFVAKFAWSPVAAMRIHREGQILLALRSAAPLLQLPEVVTATSDPALVVTRIVPGAPLTPSGIAALDRAGLDRVAADRAGFLAGLHDSSVLATVRRVTPMVVPEPQADTDSLRGRFGRWVSAQRSVGHGCSRVTCGRGLRHLRTGRCGVRLPVPAQLGGRPRKENEPGWRRSRGPVGDPAADRCDYQVGGTARRISQRRSPTRVSRASAVTRGQP